MHPVTAIRLTGSKAAALIISRSLRNHRPKIGLPAQMPSGIMTGPGGIARLESRGGHAGSIITTMMMSIMWMMIMRTPETVEELPCATSGFTVDQITYYRCNSGFYTQIFSDDKVLYVKCEPPEGY